MRDQSYSHPRKSNRYYAQKKTNCCVKMITHEQSSLSLLVPENLERKIRIKDELVRNLLQKCEDLRRNLAKYNFIHVNLPSNKDTIIEKKQLVNDYVGDTKTMFLFIIIGLLLGYIIQD